MNGTFSLVTQLVVVLPQFGDQLSSLQLDLRVGGQVVGWGALSDHSVRLNVQVPVDPKNNIKSIKTNKTTPEMLIKRGLASELTLLVCMGQGRGL